MILNTLLFDRDKIKQLPPSKAKDALMEVINLSPEEILEDITNYWCHKNLGSASLSKMNYEKYVIILTWVT